MKKNIADCKFTNLGRKLQYAISRFERANPKREGYTPGTGTLFMAFMGVGLSGFGGVLPFARRALVERRAWLTELDFQETLALCQSLPGPNIINLSVVVGSRFGGIRGAAASVGGLILAPMGVILVIASLWARFGAIGHTPGAIRALGAAAAGLVVARVAKMIPPTLRGAPFAGGSVAAATFVAVGVAHLPLPWVMMVMAPTSIMVAMRRAA